MPTTFRPPDYEFAAASGDNVNWDPDWSYFDNPPNSTSNLTITSNADDDDPGLFETGETYDLTWSGHGGGTMEDATIIRSDYISPGEGAIVFEGINSKTGELFQMVWTPGFDLEAWYWDNGGGPSSPNGFWTSDQDPENYRYVCYAAETLIETSKGPKPVQNLQVGDFVQTLDNGLQPIRWLHQDVQPLDMCERDEKPVLIGANTLGKGFPVRDTIVSPQHRILVGGQGQLQSLFSSEVFVPAKALTGLRGIRHMNGKRDVLWLHFALDRHEVVVANGCFSESLLLGKMAIDGLRNHDRAEVIEIFGDPPTANTGLNGPPARECLTVGAARHQIANATSGKDHRLNHEIAKWDEDLESEQRTAAHSKSRQAIRPGGLKRTA